MRAALYARFSTDQQSAASIPDQLRACERHAAALGAEVVERFTDAAISGSVIANRPGMVGLLHAARAGRFDLVIAEHTDRLSRSGGDSWTIFEDLRAYGIAIDTVAQGRVGAMHVGLSGTMSALLLEEGARKTRRGLEGVAREGRSAGGLSYGYRKRIAYDGRGEPIRGLRDIVEEEADVVRRIFRAYAAGMSPRAIAAMLNADDVKGPAGGPWNASTIAGNAQRGNGVLHNALYAGEIVWGRQTWLKDRSTGRRRSRLSDAETGVRQAAPELRIVDEALWQAVRARYDLVAAQAKGGRPVAARRPTRLLSGLVMCGICDGPMTMSGGRGSLRCSARIERGPTACSNSRSPGYNGLEARVLAAVKANLLQPEVVEEVVREYHRLRQAAGNAQKRADADLRKELQEVNRRAGRLIDQVADGEIAGRLVADRLAQLEARKSELEAILERSAAPSGVITLHPEAPARYRQLVEQLQDVLATPDTIEREEARSSLRTVVKEVIFHPVQGHGAYTLELLTDAAPLLRAPRNEKSPLTGAASSEVMSSTSHVAGKVGAGTGFEPVTFRL